jgi:drug/metabolite transporter (DMT)-like permease
MAIIGAVRATLISNLEPPLGIVFAILILSERNTSYEI